MIDGALRSPSLRERLFPLIWMLLSPLRLYLARFPIQRGKGILLRRIVTPLLPPADTEFDLPVPGAARVGLRYRETLGLSSLLYGTFELAELNFVSQYLRPGDKAMDIGANVGIFSVVMGVTVGTLGRVFAFEPVPANISRLESNLRKNGLGNVQVFPLALGMFDGQMMLRMATDPAYPSLREVQRGFDNGAEVPVQVRSLDGVWEELGSPDIALVKIDVEGAEADVLRGAARFLTTCRPTLLVEANSVEDLDSLRAQLCSLGYRHVRPEGFVSMNHLFIFPASGERRVSLA
jgi:FkbM family methyltransferase